MIGAKKRFVVLQRDGFRCKYCGKNGRDVSLEVDHVIPKSLGGSDDLSNLQCICRDCNLGKGARDIREGLVDIYKIKMDDSMKRLKKYFYDQLNKYNFGTIDNADIILIHKFCFLKMKGNKFNAHNIFIGASYFLSDEDNTITDVKLFEEGGDFCDKILGEMFDSAKYDIDTIISIIVLQEYETGLNRELSSFINNYIIL